MFRKSIDDLTTWIGKKNRKPLVIRGARQVGKSTLVKMFSEKQELDCIELNLEKRKLNFNSGHSVEEFLKTAELYANKKITKNALLFIDEIQSQPELIPFLRYLYEEASWLPVIATGSLLEFALENIQNSMPVGRVEYYHLGPLSFFEFLDSCDEKILLERIKNLEVSHEEVFQRASQKLKEYLFVGGMPAAVKAYVEEKSFLSARQEQYSIIETYRDDFSKYNVEITLLHKVYDWGFQHIGEKVKYSEISSDDKSAKVKDVLHKLEMAKLLTPCFHSSGTDISLAAQKKDAVYKMYAVDVGLVCAKNNIEWSQIQEDAAKPFKGKLLEQFVAQQLMYIEGNYKRPELYYWLKDERKNKAEIDFLFQHKDKIIPVEVKNKALGHLKSLIFFMESRKPNLGINFHTKNEFERKFKNIVSAPAFSIEMIKEIINQMEEQ